MRADTITLAVFEKYSPGSEKRPKSPANRPGCRLRRSVGSKVKMDTEDTPTRLSTTALSSTRPQSRPWRTASTTRRARPRRSAAISAMTFRNRERNPGCSWIRSRAELPETHDEERGGEKQETIQFPLAGAPTPTASRNYQPIGDPKLRRSKHI